MSVLKSALIIPLGLSFVAIGWLAESGNIPYQAVPVLGFAAGMAIKQVWKSI